MKNKFIFFLALIFLTNILAFVLIPSFAQADIEDDIREQLRPIQDVYDPEQEVTETTLAETIAKIIKVVLGLLGLIFIILIVYAGFTWMTSAGNEEKISKAKKIMAAAVIGTVIVAVAYMITIFVIDSLIETTGVTID